MKPLRLLAAFALTASLTTAVQAEMSTYYVGLDVGATAGTNAGHLTFLMAHGNHFHRLGVNGGATGSIPEASAGGPLKLTELGNQTGKYVSGTYHDGTTPSEYGDLEIRSFSTLLGHPDSSAESILANSSSGRYQGSLSGINLALEVVSIDAGLSVIDSLGNTLLSIGDRYTLGVTDSFSPFVPIFAAEISNAIGTSLSATFRLIDLNAADPSLTQSGNFTYNFRTAAVPEPATLVMSSLGLAGLLVVNRRRGIRRTVGGGSGRRVSCLSSIDSPRCLGVRRVHAPRFCCQIAQTESGNGRSSR